MNKLIRKIGFLLLSGLALTTATNAWAAIITIDFEGIAVGTQSSPLVVGGYKFTEGAGRDLQIVDLGAITSDPSLSKALTVADISDPAYDNTWTITLERVDGQPFELISYDFEGWGDNAGTAEEVGHGSFLLFPGAPSVIGGSAPTDGILGYQTASTGTPPPTLALLGLQSTTFPGSPATPSVDPGFLFFDNFQVSAIPEPATLTLFGAGLLGLGFMRRRVRRPV